MTNREELVYLSGNALAGLLTTYPGSIVQNVSSHDGRRKLAKLCVYIAECVILDIHASPLNTDGPREVPPD